MKSQCARYNMARGAFRLFEKFCLREIPQVHILAWKLKANKLATMRDVTKEGSELMSVSEQREGGSWILTSMVDYRELQGLNKKSVTFIGDPNTDSYQA